MSFVVYRRRDHFNLSTKREEIFIHFSRWIYVIIQIIFSVNLRFGWKIYFLVDRFDGRILLLVGVVN